jgi:hypothetical protein
MVWTSVVSTAMMMTSMTTTKMNSRSSPHQRRQDR